MKTVSRLLLLLAVLAAGCSPRKPLIGLSPCGGPSGYSISSPMPSAVFKAGGVPVLLPMVRTESEAESLVAEMDGLIMVGGEDIDPSYYGEEVLNSTVSVNSFRDTSDMLLLNAALKKNVPVLGICRGEQITNVVLGGSLYQDIPSQINNFIPHRGCSHMIRIEVGTRLHELLGMDSVMVNSSHHQAVRTPAPGLKISAYAPDGVVEAYEADGVLAVQFHPESLVASGDDRFLPIFQDLISRASE